MSYSVFMFILLCGLYHVSICIQGILLETSLEVPAGEEATGEHCILQ